MLKHFLLAALLAALPLIGRARAEGAPPQIPELSGYFLDGGRVSIPADLAEPLTLLVITHEDPGSEAFESWRSVAASLEGELPVVFVVLLGERGGIDRAVTAGRLRGSVRDPALRASMVPVFQEASVLQTKLGIVWGSPGIALLVTETGEVVWHQSGSAGQTSQGEIRSRLERAAEPVPGRIDLASATGSEAARAVSKAPAPASGDLPSPASAAPEQMPVIEGVTLSGLKRRLPRDLGETGTRLALLPGADAGDALQAVLSRMETEAETDPSDWLVLVFQGRSPPFGKAFAAGKLRAETASAAQREHVLPLYMELSAFEHLFGLPLTDKLRLITLDTSGTISVTECLEQAC